MRWLKQLFKQKKTFEEIQVWLEEQQSKLAEEHKELLGQLKISIPELKQQAQQKIEQLRDAQLRNPDIPERAKDYMRGNREQFIKLAVKFTDNLKIPEHPADLSELDILFQQFANNTARPAAIVSEFFGQEVGGVRASISAMEQEFNKVRQFYNSEEKIENVKKLISKTNTIRSEQKVFDKQKEELSEQLVQLTTKRENIQKEKEQFIQKPEYIEIKQKIVVSAKDRQDAEHAITSLLLPLSDAIKKYAHDTKNKNLGEYAEHPLNALIHDYALGLLKHKGALIEAITTNKIELKPERAQKALESLKKIDKQTLGALIHNYANTKKREADIHHEVAGSPIIKEYEQYAIDLKRINEEIKQLETTISKLERPDEQLIIEQLKDSLDEYRIVLL